MSPRKVCRACLRSGQTLSSLSDSIVPKFDTPSNSVLDLWKIFTKMLIATENNFPDKICFECLDEIQRTYFFMLKCERSEDILKKMKIAEIRLKRLETVSSLREHDNWKNIKSEHPNIAQIKNEIIEWTDEKNGSGKENTDRGKLQVKNSASVASQVDSQSQRTLAVKSEDDNLEIELLDDLDCENDVAEDEVSPIQVIKQEPELDICTEQDESLEILSEDQTSTDIIACSGCRFQCERTESLEKHIIDSHMEGKMCKLCNEEFHCSTVEHCSKHFLKSRSRNQRLKCRVKLQTGERRFKCENCSQTFLNKGNLNAHMRCHTGERPFKCDTCSKTFVYKHHLKYHLRQHTGERPYKCEKCSQTFLNKGNLNAHVRCHTGERPFQCETCSKAFVYKHHLAYHLRQHTGERPFKCDTCPKAFLCNQQLKQHLISHTGERPFKCEICPKSFQHKTSLTYHLRQHTGERLFKCENCSKTYTRKKYLLDHLKCHTGERAFKCEICPKAFLHKKHLIVHIRCHTGERQFKCDHCSKTFIHKHNLIDHLKRHIVVPMIKWSKDQIVDFETLNILNLDSALP